MPTIEELEKQRAALENRLAWAQVNTCEYTLERLRMQLSNTEVLIHTQTASEPPNGEAA